MGPGFPIKDEVQLHHLAVGIVIGVEGQVADLIILVIGGAVIEVVVVHLARPDTDIILLGIVIDIQLAVVVQTLAVREFQAVKIAVFILKEVPEVPLVEGDIIVLVHFPNDVAAFAAGFAAGGDLHSACHIAAAVGAVRGEGQLYGIFKVAVGREDQLIQFVFVSLGDIAAVIVERGILQIAVGELIGAAGKGAFVKGIGTGAVKDHPENITGILLLEQLVEISAAEAHSFAGLHLIGDDAGGAALAAAVHSDLQGTVHIVGAAGSMESEFQGHRTAGSVSVRYKCEPRQAAVTVVGNIAAVVIEPDIFQAVFIQRLGAAALVHSRKISVILQVIVIGKDEVGKTAATAAGIVIVQVSEIRAAELDFVVRIHFAADHGAGRCRGGDHANDHRHGQQEGRQLCFP